jgi:hypothetical protein
VLFHTILSPNFVTTSRVALSFLIVHGNACSEFAFQDKGYKTMGCWLILVLQRIDRLLKSVWTNPIKVTGCLVHSMHIGNN